MADGGQLVELELEQNESSTVLLPASQIPTTSITPNYTNGLYQKLLHPLSFTFYREIGSQNLDDSQPSPAIQNLSLLPPPSLLPTLPLLSLLPRPR